MTDFPTREMNGLAIGEVAQYIQGKNNMLTLQKAKEKAGIYVDTANKPLGSLLEKEWLLTNTRGGYASSTVVGCNTRRYHGLLVGSLDPPVHRILALSNCLEAIYWGPGVFNLATFEFPDRISPDGYLRLKRFSQDLDSTLRPFDYTPGRQSSVQAVSPQAGVHFNYELGDLRIRKSVYLSCEQDTTAIVYEFDEIQQSFDFALLPFVALRDFHSLQKSISPLVCASVPEGLLIGNGLSDCGQLILNCSCATFEEDPQWWFNFVYRCDRERGQEYTEDLFNPGVFKCRIDSPTKLVLWASLSRTYKPGQFVSPDIEEVIQRLSRHHSEVIAPAHDDKLLATLFLAADQFVVKRVTKQTQFTTIIAGFPWFADWGRDALISLPGLLLATRRFDEAKSVLLTFAEAASQGMIPNCFDDYANVPHFNSVDASLWFINAAFAYLEASGDLTTFKGRLLPVIVSIVDSYRHGTRFGIHADKDGLITAGDANTQLTWMDAKYAGVAFTPRYGKAVEVNALWFNALMLLNQFYDDNQQSQRDLKFEIDKVKKSFCRLFWNESWCWLNDCILPDGSIDATLRPNQIFAVSLPFSPLSLAQQKSVVNIVREKLLSPFGLRTLSLDDRRYRGIYTGPQQDRDRAYHQGTVWPYLIGPFVEAYLKVNGFNQKSKKIAARFIEPLISHLSEDGCLGQVSEIFDGDPPYKPKGCIAQAWSVAELIRANMLVV
jgi:predicted glycogen debranching enzyme